MNFKYILLYLFLCINIYAETGARYFVNYPKDSSAVTFLFPSEASSESYGDFRTAIEIVDVFCDGQKVSPSVKQINGYPDMTIVKTDGNDRLIYRCSSLMFYCFSSIEKKENGHYEIIDFKIPDGSSKIEISYRVRFPGKNASQLIKISFFESDERPSMMNLK